jgi:hypothetical protein
VGLETLNEHLSLFIASWLFSRVDSVFYTQLFHKNRPRSGCPTEWRHLRALKPKRETFAVVSQRVESLSKHKRSFNGMNEQNEL